MKTHTNSSNSLYLKFLSEKYCKTADTKFSNKSSITKSSNLNIPQQGEVYNCNSLSKGNCTK